MLSATDIRILLEVYAEAHALHYEPRGDLPPATPLLAAGLERTGVDRHSEHLMWGELPGGAEGVLAHHVAGRARHTVAVVVVHDGAALPDLFGARCDLRRVGRLLGAEVAAALVAAPEGFFFEVGPRVLCAGVTGHTHEPAALDAICRATAVLARRLHEVEPESAFREPRLRLVSQAG